MALNGTALGDAIKAAVDAVGDPTDRQAVFRAIGTAIATYLVANTQVVVTSVTGVTTGAGTSGPGTGTIT